MRSLGITNAAPWASAPPVGPAGDTYYNTTSKQLYTSDGTAWNLAGGVSQTYVDNRVDGVMWKKPCYCATTANITLSGSQTIDGVDLSTVGIVRVLVKNQTTPSQNGIYLNSSGAWARDTDFDAAGEIPGAAVYVTAGTTQADTIWTVTAPDAIAGFTLGTNPITFTRFTLGGITYGYLFTNFVSPANFTGTYTQFNMNTPAAGYSQGFTISSGRAVCNIAGKYLVTWHMSGTPSSTNGYVDIQIVQVKAAGGSVPFSEVGSSASTNLWNPADGSAIFDLAVNDYVQLNVGTNVQWNPDVARCYITIIPVGGAKGDTGPTGPSIVQAQSSYAYLTTSTTSLPSGGWNNLLWNTPVAPGTFINGFTQPAGALHQIVCQQAGKYRVQVEISANNSAPSAWVQLRINQFSGSTGNPLITNHDMVGNGASTAGWWSGSSHECILDMAVGDIIVIQGQPFVNITIDTRTTCMVTPVGGTKGDTGATGPDITAAQSSYLYAHATSPASIGTGAAALFGWAIDLSNNITLPTTQNITFSQTGKYRVAFQVSTQTSGAGGVAITTYITQFNSGGTQKVQRQLVNWLPSAASSWTTALAEAILDIVAGDFVQISAIGTGQASVPDPRSWLEVTPVGGVKGDIGPSGGPVPTGGTTNQIIVKNSSLAGDVSWKTPKLYDAGVYSFPATNLSGGGGDANLVTITTPYAGWLEVDIAEVYYGSGVSNISSGALLLYTNSVTGPDGAALQSAVSTGNNTTPNVYTKILTSCSLIVPVVAAGSYQVVVRTTYVPTTTTCFFYVQGSWKYYVN